MTLHNILNRAHGLEVDPAELVRGLGLPIEPPRTAGTLRRLRSGRCLSWRGPVKAPDPPPRCTRAMFARWPREWSWQALSAAIVAGLIVAGLVALLAHVLSQSSQDGIVGDCTPFNLYAQNQYEPYGTLLWASPSPTASNSPAFGPNQLITVDGWVRERTPYPSNQPPWDSDAWFHLADNSGWVTFAGVRATPTTPDPQGGYGPGSSPAPLDSRCAGTFRS